MWRMLFVCYRPTQLRCFWSTNLAFVWFLCNNNYACLSIFKCCYNDNINKFFFQIFELGNPGSKQSPGGLSYLFSIKVRIASERLPWSSEWEHGQRYGNRNVYTHLKFKRNYHTLFKRNLGKVLSSKIYYDKKVTFYSEWKSWGESEWAERWRSIGVGGRSRSRDMMGRGGRLVAERMRNM